MNRDELPIASPCSADFSEMTPVAALRDKGRFCGDCKKVVHDLTRMTAKEARALLAAPRAEGLCVRYLHDAAGDIVFRRELGLAPLVPPSRLTRFARAAGAAAMLAVPLSLNACMGAAPNRPPVEPVQGTVEAPPPPVEAADDAGAAVAPTSPTEATVDVPSPEEPEGAPVAQ